MSALPVLVSSPLPDPARHARASGGFAWWYLDLVNDDGDGVVAIVALGLPFLPGYASAARRGAAPPASERPAVYLTAVRGGRIVFWALHELDPDAVRWEADQVDLGDSSLRVDADAASGAVRVRATLRGELPGCPWDATLEVDGVLRRPSPGEPAAADHEWSIVCANGRGTARIRAGGSTLTLQGRGYVDRNGGTGSLEALGVRAWTWGRLAFHDHARVWYEATDARGGHASMAVTVAADGATTVTPGAVTTEGRRFGRWCLPRPAVVRFGEVVAPMGAPIDDSPFYTRHLLRATMGDLEGRGFAEVCRPGRIDAAWFRPLLRMTVCHDGRPAANSAWLPLFTGPAEGRIPRLLGWNR